ncbi:MAG: molybdopterin molybdotransferase MoeA [Spirochaetia bacterium]|nr:molybdopterin molybdotransferase MoeA [Spirochaetia bacterium]
MISYADALEALLAHTLQLESETISLNQASGRTLAANIAADRDYPPFNRATMDGYAILSSEYEKGRVYRVASWKHAGEEPAQGDVYRGLCIGISTGSAVPDQFDAVIRIEDASIDSSHNVSFALEQTNPGQNIAKRGEDTKQGEIVSKIGTKITPGAAMALASVGARTVQVFRKPDIKVISCGNEVVSLETAPLPEQIRDSNSHTVCTFLNCLGLAPQSASLIPDEPSKLSEGLRQGLIADILIVTGGVSKGPRDFIPGLLEDLGVKRLFHGVAIKPGKPVFAGTHQNKIVLALPGNPLSVLIGLEIFLLPYLRASMGSSTTRSWPMKFQGKRKKKSGLDEFFPSNVNGMGIEQASWNGSGDILAGMSHGFALHPASASELDDGDTVLFFPWTGS